MPLSPDATPRLVSLGTANPPDRYTQEEILALFRCEDPKIRGFFSNSHIRSRHLVLPPMEDDGSVPDENGTALLKKHLDTSLRIGREAVEACLSPIGLRPEHLDALVTVTSTGMLCPSLSSHLGRAMGFRRNLQRADIVGMGCNAGVNGLATAARFAAAHPGTRSMLLACEICSAAYVQEMDPVTAVVNSLFGDGAVAALVVSGPDPGPDAGPKLLDFEAYLLHEAAAEMRFDFVDGKFSFYLGRDVPYAIGEHVGRPVGALLSRHGLRKRDITHWIVHSGGKKVIDAVKYNLGLTSYDVRHTESILRNYGNLSSASFLFSLQELGREKIAREGEYGLAIAMGPGVSIETALFQW